MIITGALTGKAASEKLSKRCELLRAAIIMTDKMSTLIRYRSLTVYEIAENLKADNALKVLSFLQKISNDGTAFEKKWCEASKEIVKNLEADEIQEIKLIGTELGKSDCEGQISTLALRKKTLEEYLVKAENQKKTNGKLYRSLGILAGFLLAIILI